MRNQLLFGSVFLLCLTGCDSHPAGKAGKDSLITLPAVPDTSGVVTISPALLKRYEDSCLQDTNSYDKKFTANFIDLIKKFNGKKLDTTLLTIGNLDGDAEPDTITSRVYDDSGSIYVDSKWIKNNRVLWKDKYSDPYTSLGFSSFSDTSNNTWLFFGVGVFYGPPEIHPRSDLDSGALGMVYDQGVDDLNKAGVRIDKEQYKAYLQGFKGDLLAYGEPESREGLSIWYKPGAIMITYYHP